MAWGLLVLGKNLNGSGPSGPWSATRDELPEPHTLAIRCRVNGQLRQDAKIAQCIFRVREISEHWSQMTLHPGDLIATGTLLEWQSPTDPREWLLKPGAIVEVGIERIGVLRPYIA